MDRKEGGFEKRRLKQELMGMSRNYPLTSSPIYRLSSKRKLAFLLGVPLQDLLFLIEQSDNYRLWPTRQRRRDELVGLPHKPRNIQQPKPLLSLVHKRLAMLLGRIEKPGFVYSATKFRCYVDNAKQHASNHRAVKIDIKNFYQNVSRKFVRDFFEHSLECASDVAHVLTKICCITESSEQENVSPALPTGSAVSPVLSFFACSAMFKRIAKIADEHGLMFTLYVDDMMFSGNRANRDFTNLVVHELAKHGFIGHKITHFPDNSVKIVTGVAVSESRIDLPYRRQKRIRQFEEAFWKATHVDDVRVLGAALLGQYREAERVKPGSKLRAQPIEDYLAKLAPAVPQAAKVKSKKRRGIRVSPKLFAALRAAKAKSSPNASPSIDEGVSESLCAA